MVYTRMENSVQAEAEVMKLLPLERSDFGEMKMPLNMYREEIELNPSPMAVMNSIVPSYINGMIYGCLVEAYASEHNARMMAGSHYAGDHGSLQWCESTAEEELR